MSNGLIQSREVLVYNQPKQKHFIFRTATDKWKELADLIMNQPELEVSDITKMRAVVSSTENTLELPNAIIPEGPQKIFLFEAKVKSGVDYERMGYLDLRKLVKSKGLNEGLGSNPTKTELIDRLEDAAQIKKSKVTSLTKTGKEKTKVIKTPSEKTKSIKEKDQEILDNQPELNERVQSLELGFAKLIQSLLSACTDFVAAPAEAKMKELKAKSVAQIGNTSISDLEKEANKLKLNPRAFDNDSK